MVPVQKWLETRAVAAFGGNRNDYNARTCFRHARQINLSHDTFMSTLLWFVILYWVISISVGLYASRMVSNSKDFAVAGRALPM